MRNGTFSYYVVATCKNDIKIDASTNWLRITEMRDCVQRKGILSAYIEKDNNSLESISFKGINGSQNFNYTEKTYDNNGKFKYDSQKSNYYIKGLDLSYRTNFPIFSSADACNEFLTNGSNYKDAINYNPNKIKQLKYGTDFSPTYKGGDITVNLNRLNNFTDYYVQVINNNKDKDADEILNILRNYINTDYELALSRHDNNILKPNDNNTIDIEILSNIENIDYSKLSWHGIGIESVSYNGNIATLSLSPDLHVGDYNINAVYDNGSDIYLISPSLSINVFGSELPSEETPETETAVSDSIAETNTWLQKIYIRIGEFKKEVKKSLDNVIKELKKIRRWTALDTIFDGLDAVADWLDFVTKFFDNVTDGIGLLVSSFTDTVTELTKVFPFSIPITLVLIVQMFSAPPEAPKFELPLKLDAFNIDEKIVIDLSQFQVISVISRTFLTIIYCVGLYHLTFKIISAKKGG